MDSKRNKICHITSVHSRNDTRIFVKECVTLARDGFEVHLIVADGKGTEVRDEVVIHDVGKPTSRLRRILNTTSKIYKKALSIDAEIYHFHDPELIFTGKKLVSKGKKVIYDVHEDVPRQILSKPYLNSYFTKIVSKMVQWIEDKYSRRFTSIITATEHIGERFRQTNRHTIVVFNYPFLAEFKQDTMDWSIRREQVCYIGGISKVRGISENILALDIARKKMALGGVFQPPEYESQLRDTQGWEYVDFLGYLDRKQVSEVLSTSKAGLVTLHPIINYLDSLPVKMFEYMASGIPVIASNFPLWQEIISTARCGICVDPMNPKQIANAITYLLDNDDICKEMGENGRKAVLNKYNWENEGKKLLQLYKELV